MLPLLAFATTAELFALAWAAIRRGVSEIAVAGVIGGGDTRDGLLREWGDGEPGASFPAFMGRWP